jgi:hypothetical protein
MINAIQIPKPCHQDWNAMTTNEQGRHCLQCCKTVVDFTNKEPEEIVQYLKEYSGQGVCGRFTSAQINTPIVVMEEITFHIFSSSLSYFKKIAALILITFGILVTSANKGFSQTGKTTTPTTGAPQVIETPKVDSSITPMMVGKIKYTPAHPKPVVKKKATKKKAYHKIPNNPRFIQGDVEVVPLMGAVRMTPDSSN